jgi:hypothetical protein
VGAWLLVVAARRWRPAPRPLPAGPRALRELQAGPADSAGRFDHIDRVLRGYLDERFGLATCRQTTREALAGCRGLPQAAKAGLAELLGRCDRVKFSGEKPTQEECAEGAELARQVILACEAIGAEPGKRES